MQHAVNLVFVQAYKDIHPNYFSSNIAFSICLLLNLIHTGTIFSAFFATHSGHTGNSIFLLCFKYLQILEEIHNSEHSLSNSHNLGLLLVLLCYYLNDTVSTQTKENDFGVSFVHMNIIGRIYLFHL